jgi:hypothetical protein
MDTVAMALPSTSEATARGLAAMDQMMAVAVEIQRWALLAAIERQAEKAKRAVLGEAA